MEFKTLIKERRSIRSFAKRSVDNAVIKEIIADALLAPTWKNSETGRYYVANTPESIEMVRKSLPLFNKVSSKNAALVVTTYVQNKSGFTNGKADNELGNEWGAYDLGLQNAYFVLSATEHGLDTLIMGIRESDILRQIFNIPAEEQVVAVIALGYKNKEASIPKRKQLDDVAKFL